MSRFDLVRSIKHRDAGLYLVQKSNEEFIKLWSGDAEICHARDVCEPEVADGWKPSHVPNTLKEMVEETDA